MDIPLQSKIFIGFASVLAVTCGLAAVLLYERRKMREIEREMDNMHTIYEASNGVHEKSGRWPWPVKVLFLEGW